MGENSLKLEMISIESKLPIKRVFPFFPCVQLQNIQNQCILPRAWNSQPLPIRAFL